MSEFSATPEKLQYEAIPAKNTAYSAHQYKEKYTESIADPSKFWSEASNKYLKWFTPYQRVMDGDFESGDINWFQAGTLNACYNCIDKHLPEKADQAAIIWERDEKGTAETITYSVLSKEVCKIANVMKSKGVKKGDVVTIYMPMIPQTAMVMLACARIGAIHSVVFAGFSMDALRDRINGCDSKASGDKCHGTN